MPQVSVTIMATIYLSFPFLILFSIFFVDVFGDCSGDACFQFRFPPSSGVNNPCKNYKCPHNAWCIPSDDFRSPKCVCHQTCFDVGDSDDNIPVCGSNGITYKSLCHLKREACTLMADIEVKYWGKCGMFSVVSIHYPCLHETPLPS